MLSQKNAGLDVQVFNEKLKKIKEKFTTREELERVKAPSELAALLSRGQVKKPSLNITEQGVPFKTVVIETHNPITNIVLVSLLRQDGKPTCTHFSEIFSTI